MQIKVFLIYSIYIYAIRNWYKTFIRIQVVERDCFTVPEHERTFL